MRIGIVSETFLPKWDGVANTVCRLLEHIQERGHEAIMMAPEGAPSQYAGTPIIGQPRFSCPFYPALKIVQPRVGMGAELEEFAPDIIHMANPAFMSMVMLRRARNMGVPVIMSYHTDIPGYMEKYGMALLTEPVWQFHRWIHNEADMTVCPSQTCLDELDEHGFERLGIWGRGVDTTLYNPLKRNMELRRKLTGGNPGAPLMVYVGRLAVEKRVDVIRPVMEQWPEAHLAIVGDGPERESLEKLFAGTNTTFLGYQKGEDLAAAYASADIFVFPGENETFGNVVLEAQASGLPVLAARAGGPIDHVFDGRNGFLFEPGNSTHLINRLHPVMEDLAYRKRLVEGALNYARSQTWSMIMDGLFEKYEWLVAENPNRMRRAG
jgi:glycosyltransferase involved in cell wall biosynthesis